ncbi:MAG: DUF1552 domain-containing protein [Sandaracinaceae bacterium]
MEAQPKLIFFASPNSSLVGPTGNASLGYSGWVPSGLPSGDGAAEVALGARLPDIMEPLAAHTSSLLPIFGLRGADGVGGHQQAVCILTGTGVFNDEEPRASGGDGEFYGDGQSVDQLIAQRIGSRVLGLSYDIQGFNLGEGYISHLAPNRGFTPIQNPVDAFEQVFGEAGVSDAERAQRQLRRRSVLDSITRDLGALSRRLPAPDAARLEQHTESVRALETDLVAVPTCTGSGAPGSYDHTSSRNIPRLMGDYARLMVQSMACGYTRVGFIQAGNLGGSAVPSWPELGITTTFKDHAINHAFEAIGGAGSEGLAQRDAIPLGINLQKAYNTFFAGILDELAATPDVDGRPMLDHTIVVHIKQMGMNHDRRQLLWTLAGGGALGVRGGRFMRTPLTNAGSRYVNDLHVTLCRLMGVTDVESFGTASANRAPLDLG